MKPIRGEWVIMALVLVLEINGAGAGEKGATEAPRQVFVVNTGDGTVSLVDLVTMKATDKYPVGPRPYEIAVSKDGKTVAVGVEDEECVKFFSLPDFKEKGRTTIGKMFNDHIVLTQDGKYILVADFFSDDVFVIDREGMKEAYRIKDCSAPHVVKYGPSRITPMSPAKRSRALPSSTRRAASSSSFIS